MVGPVASFLFGLLLLIAGAEALVRGASRLARLFGLSPLVIGLTVVAFGTSAPEMAVSVQGAMSNQGGGDIALGNVIGSNIFNVLVILGLSSLISPLAVSYRLIRFEVPVMIGVSLLVFGLALDGSIGRGEGVFLLVGIFLYTGTAIREGRRETQVEVHDGESGGLTKHRTKWTFSVVLVAAGFIALVAGATVFVDGAVAIARSLRVSELVISLTLVAAGTSLPELATSAIAAFRGERDIAVGNVVGSNLFNLLAILGSASVLGIRGIPVPPSALALDIPVMCAVTVLCLPIFFTGFEIARWEGALFLTYYVAYVAYLFVAAADPAEPPLGRSTIWLWILAPTLVPVAVTVLRDGLLRARSSSGRR
jgi:cation:H+ antiporter